MQSELERDFDRAMVQIYEVGQREIGYNASRFLQMVLELGGVQAARQLLRTQTPSDGFTILWEAGRLDLTVESYVLKPEFTDLFTDDERGIARRRLNDYTQ